MNTVWKFVDSFLFFFLFTRIQIGPRGAAIRLTIFDGIGLPRRWNRFAALHHLYVMLAETRYFFLYFFFFGEMCVISRYNDYIVYTRSMEINSRRSAQQV